VPESDELGAALHRRDDSLPHDLRFAAVHAAVEDIEAFRIGILHRLNHAQRSVAAAVVREKELDVVALETKVEERFRVEPLLFVVAGDDDGHAHGGVLYGTIE